MAKIDLKGTDIRRVRRIVKLALSDHDSMYADWLKQRSQKISTDPRWRTLSEGKKDRSVVGRVLVD